MRKFDINPLDYSDYNNSNLYEGERVYHFNLNDGSDAYAICENGEEYEEFEREVEWMVRSRKGSRSRISIVEEVTDIFEDE